MSNLPTTPESMDSPYEVIRPHELMWIKRKKGLMWPGFLIKIRTVESTVRMHYRFILGKPRTYVSPLKEGRFRKLRESDVLDDEQKQVPGLVASFESARNYLITQANLKGKGKVKLFTPMEYFFPSECSYRSAKKRKTEISEVHLVKSPKIEKSDDQQPGTSKDHFNEDSPPKDTPGKLQVVNPGGMKLRARSQEPKLHEAKFQAVKPREAKLRDAKGHEAKLQEIKLLEMKLLHAKELHEAKMRNERQFYKESREICEARIAAVEISTMLSEELHLIEKETAQKKAQEAEINKKIALAKLKMVELELKNLESFS